jgi:pyruvyltransferase
LEKVFGYKVVWAQPDQCDLVGVGSILELVNDLSLGKTFYAWGSGYIREDSDPVGENIKCVATRGHLSASRFSSPPKALGDPGLLVPLAFEPSKEKKYRLGVVPHYVDVDSDAYVAFLEEHQDVHVINPLWDVSKVIEEITACEALVSSSLHGLIIADAYDVPNIHMTFSDKLVGGDYKFDDYYSVFPDGTCNRKPLEESIDDLASWIIDGYQPIDPDILKGIQQGLIGAFPFQTKATV